MKHLVFALFCCMLIAAQQGSKKDKFEFCGRSSSHECYCLRHTQAVQDEYLENCRANSSNEKQWRDCAAAMPGHCSIAAEQAPPVDDEQGEGQPDMSDYCALACKKHDCFCDDGPRCHIGHTASEHSESVKNK